MKFENYPKNINLLFFQPSLRHKTGTASESFRVSCKRLRNCQKWWKVVCNDEMHIFLDHYVLLKIICPLFSYEQTWRVNQHFSKAFKSSMEWCVIINYGCLFEIFIYIQKYISVVVILRSKSSIFTHRCRFRKLRYLKVP